MLDIEIRTGLKEVKLKHFYQDSSSKIVDEFRFPSTNSRIDLAVINGSLHGYEIKGSSDNLCRLPNQLSGYAKILDYLIVVTEPKHITHVETMIPNWVGLTICQYNNDILEFIDIKQPLKNPNRLFILRSFYGEKKLLTCYLLITYRLRKKIGTGCYVKHFQQALVLSLFLMLSETNSR